VSVNTVTPHRSQFADLFLFAQSAPHAVEQRVASIVLLAGSFVSAVGAGAGIVGSSLAPEEATPFELVTMPAAAVVFTGIFIAILTTGVRYSRQIAYMWVIFAGLFNLLAIANSLFISPSLNLVFYLLWMPLYYIFLSVVLSGRPALYAGWGCFFAVIVMFLVSALRETDTGFDVRQIHLLVQSAISQAGTLGLMYFLDIYRRRFIQESARSSDFQDIAEELESEVQREKEEHLKVEIANQATTRFLAGMSHELRTPLNAINGFSEIMEQEMFGPMENAKYREYIQDIHCAGKHLLAMVDDILDIAKIEAGRMELKAEPVCLSRIAEDAMKMTAAGTNGRFLEVRAEIPPELPRMMGDARALRQIAINLVSNARKYTASSGHIILRADLSSNGGILFEVVDTGIGIPEEEIARVVEPFYHLDTPISRKYEGSGLGLSLVKRLVELHGGELSIVSTVGKGTIVGCEYPQWRTVKTPG